MFRSYHKHLNPRRRYMLPPKVLQLLNCIRMFTFIHLLLIILSLLGGSLQSCIWSNWSTWTGCSDKCGTKGVQRRSRFVYWRSCSGPTADSRPCNRMCYNSGIPRAGYCDCAEDYWGKCCEHGKLDEWTDSRDP